MKIIADSMSQLNNEEALNVSTHAVEKIFSRLVIFEEEVRIYEVLNEIGCSIQESDG